MLEEVQVAQLLDLGVVNRVFPRDFWMGKTSTSREIDINRERRWLALKLTACTNHRALMPMAVPNNSFVIKAVVPQSAHRRATVMVPPTLVHPTTSIRPLVQGVDLWTAPAGPAHNSTGVPQQQNRVQVHS